VIAASGRKRGQSGLMGREGVCFRRRSRSGFSTRDSTFAPRLYRLPRRASCLLRRMLCLETDIASHNVTADVNGWSLWNHHRRYEFGLREYLRRCAVDGVHMLSCIPRVPHTFREYRKMGKPSEIPRPILGQPRCSGNFLSTSCHDNKAVDIGSTP